MDKLPRELDKKSVYYGKKNEIDLNYELSDGAKEVLNQNMKFMFEKCVAANIHSGNKTNTVKITTLKKSVLRYGTSMTSKQVYTFLMPLVEEDDLETQYEEKNIRFVVTANKFCDNIGVSAVFMQPDDKLTVTWNRTYDAVLITKFKIQTNNRYATQLMLNS